MTEHLLTIPSHNLTIAPTTADWAGFGWAAADAAVAAPRVGVGWDVDAETGRGGADGRHTVATPWA